MTLQEAKNEVARQNGFDDWFSIDFSKSNLSEEVLRDEVAIVYARSKWDEACQAQINSCLENLRDQDSLSYGDVASAPKPEFKP